VTLLLLKTEFFFWIATVTVINLSTCLKMMHKYCFSCWW